MKILILSPWHNPQFPLMKRFFSGYGHEVVVSETPKPKAFLKWADLVIIGWANQQAEILSRLPKTCPYICYVRSYELFEGCLAKKVAWKNIDAQIFVNPALEQMAKAIGIHQGERSHMIPNSVDLDQFAKQEHCNGRNLAFVADLSHKKGLDLLAQIFMSLDEGFELHIAGQQYEAERRHIDSFRHILRQAGCIDRVHFYGKVADIAEWLKDKNYILSTSPIEGCPNNVLEAMSLGIKPIVYSWPGATELLGSEIATFTSISEAVQMIASDDYESEKYREIIQERFAPAHTLERLRSVAESLIEKEKLS